MVVGKKLKATRSERIKNICKKNHAFVIKSRKALLYAASFILTLTPNLTSATGTTTTGGICSAVCGTYPSTACSPLDCGASQFAISNIHSVCLYGGTAMVGTYTFNGCTSTSGIIGHIGEEFSDHKDWLQETFFEAHILPAMQKMAEQLTAVGMSQIFSVGKFLDAKDHMETQRLMQTLQHDAYKDYQPSEGFCTIGTAVRSVAHAEQNVKVTARVLTARQSARQLGTKGIGGAQNTEQDLENRWNLFRTVYCDPQDNNWLDGIANSGLSSVCNHTGTNPDNVDRINLDVDYARALGSSSKRTLDLDGPNWVDSLREIDILSLGNNLYGHNIISSRNISAQDISDPSMADRYLALRALTAKRSVAENSFNHLVGLKASNATGYVPSEYIGKLLEDLGIPNTDIEIQDYIGPFASSNGYFDEELPLSYYATLELLAKKIYQNPVFYAQLYESPANTTRKSAALQAIELMLDREIYNSQIRREMAMSVLLSTRLQSHVKDRPNEVWR